MHRKSYFHRSGSVKIPREWREMLRGMERRWKAPKIQSAALLVIDMQRYFLDPSSHAFVPSAPAIVPHIQGLLQLFRRKKRPIVFTRFAVEKGEEDLIERFWGESVAEGSADSRIEDALKPEKGEKVLRKTSYSSFRGTDLERSLRRRKVRQLVICGVLTNLCCETAAREAFECGLDVFFVADATAAYTEEMHRASLLNLSYGFATPVSALDLRPLRPSP